LRHEGAQCWDLPVLFARAREAGQAGQLQRALLLYEQAELRSIRSPSAHWARHRARLGVVRALSAAGRHRLARTAVEDLLGERLPDEARAWAFFFYARTSLALGQMLLARAAHLSLKEIARPWPPEIEAAAPAFEGEYLYFENRIEQALGAFLTALDAARRSCERPLESLCLCRLAEIGRRQGQLSQALDWIGRARDLAQTHGIAQMLVQGHTEEGRIQLARRRPTLAREAWSRARQLARKFELSGELFDVYWELWRLAVQDGDHHEARAALRSLHHLARSLETIPEAAEEVLARGRCAAAAPAGPVRRAAPPPVDITTAPFFS
jgi:tetratricopeptide (TPR) repeat protein